MDRIQEATICFNNNELQKAEDLAIEELKYNPNNEDAVDVLAAVFLKSGRSVLLEKGGAKNLDNIRRVAVYLNNLKLYPQSMVFYKKTLQIEPRDYIGLNNLGLIYENMQDDENAKIMYEKSIRVKQNYEALYNLGIYYRKQKDTENGIRFLKRAMQFKPNDAQLEYSLGMLYFMDGNFEEGYPHFLKRKTYNADFLRNFWDGTEHKGSTILVFCDYGFGDAIMYSRYFPYLKNYFAKVKVFCSKRLKPLFEQSFKDIEFCTEVETLAYDYSVLAMNLPYYLKMDFTQIPSAEGYLVADDKKVKEYKEKHFNTDKIKVGLFWLGGEKEKRTARTRKIPLQDLSKILEFQNMQFYSFQVEDYLDDISVFPQIYDLGATFNDFSDTAAALKNLDVLVSIDSAVVHLAGALGVKSYLMLPKSSEWRWFKDEKKTVWYNSVELFTQNVLYDWSNVVNDIYKALYML